MSRSKRSGGKGPGFEYWSRRPGWSGEIGKIAKRRTHKAERKQGKKIEDKDSTKD